MRLFKELRGRMESPRIPRNFSFIKKIPVSLPDSIPDYMFFPDASICFIF